MKLLFCGDMTFAHNTGKRTIFSHDFQKLKDSFDFTCVNFESSMKSKCYKKKKIGPQLILDEKMCEPIKNANFDLLCLANNHVMDQGIDGLRRIKSVFAGTAMIGADEIFEKAYSPHIIECEKFKIGILNFSENGFGAALCENMGGYAWFNHPSIKERIAHLKSNCDYVIVIVHAGAENWDYPLPEIRDKYKKFVDWGASVIIAHHPHTSQGWEQYKKAWIFYSLGNFAFYEGKSACNEQKAVCAALEISDNAISCYPIYTIFKDGVVELCYDESFIDHIMECNYIISNLALYWKNVNKSIIETYEKSEKSNYSQVNGIYTQPSLKNIVKTIVKRYIWREKFSERWLYHNLMIETHLWVTQRALSIKMRENEV